MVDDSGVCCCCWVAVEWIIDFFCCHVFVVDVLVLNNNIHAAAIVAERYISLFGFVSHALFFVSKCVVEWFLFILMDDKESPVVGAIEIIVHPGFKKKKSSSKSSSSHLQVITACCYVKL